MDMPVGRAENGDGSAGSVTPDAGWEDQMRNAGCSGVGRTTAAMASLLVVAATPTLAAARATPERQVPDAVECTTCRIVIDTVAVLGSGNDFSGVASFYIDGRGRYRVLESGIGVDATAQGVPEIRLSTSDARERGEFTQVTSVRELSDGSVLVADRRERRLVHLNFETEGATEVGRRGEGPGETRGVHRVYAFGLDTTILTDGSSRRWIVFAGDRPVQTLTSNRALNEALGPDLWGADRFGRVLGAIPSHWRTQQFPDVLTADSLTLVLAHIATQRLDTIAVVRGRGEVTEAVFRTRAISADRVGPNPLKSEDQALLFEDGWVALVRSTPYRVSWRTNTGTIVSGPTLPRSMIRVDNREKCAALGRVATRRESFVCRPETIREWPEYLPPFLPNAITPLPGGHLAIARTPSAATREGVYDVVNRQGELESRLVLPEGERLIGSGRQSVYVLVTDQDDVQAIRRYRWPGARTGMLRRPVGLGR
jgi:hypothetical protein